MTTYEVNIIDNQRTMSQSFRTRTLEENTLLKERKATGAFLPQDMTSFKDNRLTFMIDGDSSMADIRSTDEKDLKKFCTGSKYIGKWNALGPAERGVYRFPHGVIYDGQFNHNGEFHGPGALIYPNGHRVDALWNHGKLYSQQVMASNNDAFLTADYCKMPDRRFQIELETELRPAPQEYVINSPYPPAPIPEGFFYTDDGYYGPEFKAILSYDEPKRSPVQHSIEHFDNPNIDPARRAKLYKINQSTESDRQLYDHLKTDVYEQKMKINSIPSKAKEKWIIKHCRRALDKNVGYLPEFYEYWTTGVHADEERLAYFLADRFRKKSSTTRLDDASQSVTELSGKTANFIQKPSSLQSILNTLKAKNS